MEFAGEECPEADNSCDSYGSRVTKEGLLLLL